MGVKETHYTFEWKTLLTTGDFSCDHSFVRHKNESKVQTQQNKGTNYNIYYLN